MTKPFDRVLTVLTYIWGPMINDWVNAQEEHLAECTNPLNCGWVFKTDEALWQEFKSAFKEAMDDGEHSEYLDAHDMGQDFWSAGA
jgi:hypothetical protein